MDLFDYVNGELDENILYAKDGIRLKKLELYNWGTFDEKVWKYTPDGNASLITGQPGAGKSTIVDALITLLVPQRKVAYNKAADSSAKERSIRTYALGSYGRRHDVEGRGITESLRDENSYSVILATFEDKSLKAMTTLAIFFWFEDANANPKSFFVVSKKELFIVEHFTNFKSDYKFLKARLKTQGEMVFDKFSYYSEYYRKRLGNLSEQAVDLFQQTISMKNVQNLNNFVRTSMLEKEEVDDKINGIIKHYENLNSTYESVLKARKQIKLLEPICEDGEKYANNESELIKFDLAIDSIEYWFASNNIDRLNSKIKETQGYFNKIEQEIKQNQNYQKDIDEKINTISIQIMENGGGEIERLENEIKNKNYQLKNIENDIKTYNEHANILGLKPVNSIEDFTSNIENIDKLDIEIKEENISINDKLLDLAVNIKSLEDQQIEYDEEINSLSSRLSNIPKKFVDLREKICEDLKISKELLPFAGELLEVKESELKWEGAIERLINNFAISLLVHEDYYSKVLKWVNKNHLGMKLVYYKINKRERADIFHLIDENSVASKIDIKNDNVCTKWLTYEVHERFSHVCCENIEDFTKQNKAISITGQIKSSERHEKDDRTNLNNRTKFVLGFSNRKKLERYRELYIECKNNLKDLTENKKELLKNQSNNIEKVNALTNIRKYDNYQNLDISAICIIIKDAKTRIDELKNSNDKLLTLKNSLDECKKEKDVLTDFNNDLNMKKGELNLKLNQLKLREKNCQNILDLETEKEKNMYSFFEENYTIYVGNVDYTIENSDMLEKIYREKLIKESNIINGKLKNIKSTLEKNMDRFINEYPVEMTDITSDVKSLAEFKKLFEKLQFDNLPKFEETFKRELQKGVIHQIVIFNSILKKNSENIQNRINEINKSLSSIDYNKGRYIKIICENTTDSEIREFIQQLRICTEGIYSGAQSDEIDEIKFMQIKKILERFKGRQDFAYIDEKWTNKVTDVRNWFVFSASERFRENDEEYEHYSDADGKSGGQKEKLAYTILAASLAYNYKTIEQKNGNKSTFRLVVIDEAFLKGSDSSATYGLSLFEKMQFQLIVITPLLKIRTIEPFISHVGFISQSEETHKSNIGDMTIEVFNEKCEQLEGN